MANKDKQIEKRNQEMARRKAEAEAREQALKAKKKKNAIIAIVVVSIVVLITCAIAIPLGIMQSRKYTEVNFKKLSVPTTIAEAQSMPQYNKRNVVMEGYTFACTSRYYVLCKSEVQACPYVVGSVPNNGVRMEMKNESRFPTLGSNVRVRVYGTMYVNAVNVEMFEGLETYMWLELDKIEEI